MFPWKTLLKKAKLYPQLEAQLDIWARASFLESWLRTNKILPPYLNRFSSGGPTKIEQGLAIIEQKFGGDLIAPQWTSRKARRFYTRAIFKAKDYLQTFDRAFNAEEEIQDLFQEKASKGFALAGSKLSNLSLSDPTRSENTVLAWMRTYFFNEARQFAIKFFRRKSLLNEELQGPLRDEMPARKWTTDNLLSVLLAQMFNPVGMKHPVDAARTIIRKIWKAWDSELGETRLTILNEKRRDPRAADTSVARAVSLQLGREITRRQVNRAKEAWEDIARRVISDNPRLLGELEDAVQTHIQMGVRTPRRFASQFSLRRKAIRLAYRKPSLRNLLLPLL